MKRRCDKDCFANVNGKCSALTEAYRGKCPFQRTDITREQQYADTVRYNSLRSIYGESERPR